MISSWDARLGHCNIQKFTDVLETPNKPDRNPTATIWLKPISYHSTELMPLNRINATQQVE